jgi:hypothetical protein
MEFRHTSKSNCQSSIVTLRFHIQMSRTNPNFLIRPLVRDLHAYVLGEQPEVTLIRRGSNL